MNNGMLSEQDDLSWCANEPYTVLSFPRRMLIISKFLHCAANSDSSAGESGANKLVLISACRDSDCPGLEEGMFKVIDEVHRVFDANTQANEVLGQATFRTQSRINRSMAVWGDIRDTMKVKDVVLTT